MAIFGMLDFLGWKNPQQIAHLIWGGQKFPRFPGVEKSLGSLSGTQFPLDFPSEPTVREPNRGFQSWSGIKRCNAGTVTWCRKRRNETKRCGVDLVGWKGSLYINRDLF